MTPMFSTIFTRSIMKGGTHMKGKILKILGAALLFIVPVVELLNAKNEKEELRQEIKAELLEEMKDH